MMGLRQIASSLHSGTYRPDIDGIRAIAVVSVIISHGFPTLLPGGFVGVDIFFVLSGYLISSILIKSIQAGNFSILHFYDRRVRRIFPALIATLLAVILAGWTFLFRPEFANLGWHVVSSALFSENFMLWSEAGYFDVSSKLKPTLHLWSLAIEEQFYIFWPLILVYIYKKKINFMAALYVMAAASFALNLWYVSNDPTAAYYSPLGRFWELMIGAALAHVELNFGTKWKGHANVRSLAGVALIVISLFAITEESRFPGWWALLPTFGTLLLLSSGPNAWFNQRVLSTGPMVWCGLISYPLYLWHWPLLSYGHIVIGSLSPTKTLGLVVVTFVLATATFAFVERPFRQRGDGAFKVVALCCAMLCVLAVGVLMIARVVPPRLSLVDAPNRHEWDFLKVRTPNFDRNAVGIYPLEAGRSKVALFIGDSHVAQYAERIHRTISSDPLRPGAILAIGGGCIPIDGVFSDQIIRGQCWALRDQAYDMARDARHSTVVIGGSWNWYFLSKEFYYKDAGKTYPLLSAEGRKAALDRLAARIETLVRDGKRVVFVLDNPADNALSPTGLAVRLGANGTGFEPGRTIRIDPRQVELHDEMLQLAMRAGAEVVDPFLAVCTAEGLCRMTDAGGRPIYKDAGHFNPDWALENASFIDAATAR